MNVLVTGGLGFVGRHFATRLVDDGHDVVIVDNLSSGIPFPRWPFRCERDVRLHYTDFRNYVSRAYPDDFDLIIHCAAVVGGRANIDGHPMSVAENLAIDSDFFRWVAASKNKKQKIVYFSSSAVYPAEVQNTHFHIKMHEALVDFSSLEMGAPDQVYGWAKLTGEYLAQHAAKTYGTDVVIYRPFSGYGEDQDLSYPFPALIDRVVKRDNPLTVWGTGEQVRDWIHIDDIVEGVLSTMNKIEPGTAMNLGSGIGTPFRELALDMASAVGYQPMLNCLVDKPSGVLYRVADTARQLYTPKIALYEGIKRSLAFVLDRHKEAV